MLLVTLNINMLHELILAFISSKQNRVILLPLYCRRIHFNNHSTFL